MALKKIENHTVLMYGCRYFVLCLEEDFTASKTRRPASCCSDSSSEIGNPFPNSGFLPEITSSNILDSLFSLSEKSGKKLLFDTLSKSELDSYTNSRLKKTRQNNAKYKRPDILIIKITANVIVL